MFPSRCNGRVVTSCAVPRGREVRRETQTEAATDSEIRQKGDPEETGHRELDGGEVNRTISGERDLEVSNSCDLRWKSCKGRLKKVKIRSSELYLIAIMLSVLLVNF